MDQRLQPGEYLAEAVRLATENAERGGGPFGAVVVLSDDRAFTGVDRTASDSDPTAHAEVLAIRAACAELGTCSLVGAVLYASCEPCPMCLAAALWARVSHVVHAADRHDAAQEGFDDARFHQYFEDPHHSLMPIEQETPAGGHGSDPFRARRDAASRTDHRRGPGASAR